jgi:hypothetical protein
VGFGGAWWFGWLCLVSGFGSLVSLVVGWLILWCWEWVARAIFRQLFSGADARFGFLVSLIG